jgi:CubicO group peptidase (beta-lactamase class C family)
MHKHLAAGLCGLGLLAGPALGQTSDLETEIDTMRRAYGVSGLAVTVVSGPDVVMARGFGSFESGEAGADSACTLYSATKALTALTLASLIEDGQVDLETPLGDLLADSPEAWADIPLWRLYNHTSGIAMIVNRDAFGAIAEDPDAGNAAIYEVVRELPLDFAPGEHSRYQQSGYAVAEMIAEQRLGASWPELVRRHLTGPAGAALTVHSEIADGTKNVPMITSAGAYRTTPADMARLFQALNAGRIADRAFVSGLLFDPRYIQDGYGLGVIVEETSGEMTLGHRGGGARANIRYAPQSGIGVMACTDQIANRELTIHVGEMVMNALISGEPPRPHIATLLYGSPDQSAAMLAGLFEQELNDPDTRYGFNGDEAVLNGLGYNLLEDAPEQARILFELNSRVHPDSANVWDSLADAQLALGQSDAALDSMRRALSLQPANPYFQARVAEHAPE